VRPVLIYGAGGSGRETDWLVQRRVAAGDAGHGLTAAYVDDDPDATGTTVGGLPVLPFDVARTAYPEALWVHAVGASAVRRRLVERCEQAGLHAAPALVDPSVDVSGRLELGVGTLVAAGAVLTTDVHLGRYVHVNVGCSVSHDSRLEDFVTLAPGVRICGNVHVQPGAWLGAGAVVINGRPGAPLVIGEDAVVGAGACVIRPVPAGGRVAGVPARALDEPAS
jgi:sugar O-acyltransferase (sialic acid O-acetyltransferase NeuD family)